MSLFRVQIDRVHYAVRNGQRKLNLPERCVEFRSYKSADRLENERDRAREDQTADDPRKPSQQPAWPRSMPEAR